MLRVLTFCFVFVCLAHAQEQEKKLLDRLLKPDMALQNDAQAKQFTAAGTTTTKTVRMKSFRAMERRPEKGFWDTRQASTKEYRTATAPDAYREAMLATQAKISNTNTPYPTSTYQVHDASEARKSARTTNYPDTQPFLDHGKSQKSLHAQDHPMTIDEVRELLNKNK